MTSPGGATGQRAVALWRELSRIYSQRQVPPPPGAAPRIGATPQDVADILLHVAAAFNEFVTTGTMTSGRAEQSMLALLLVRDQLVPLPARLAGSMTADFQQVLNEIRHAQEDG